MNPTDLSQLRDIHLPEAVPWWPPAPGWWMLFALVIAGAVGVMLILGLIFTLLTTPIYRATTMIQIDREVANITNIEGVTPDDSRNLEFYQTMYGQLKSRTLALRVVQKENLASDPAFMNQSKPSGFKDSINKLLGRSKAQAANLTAPLAARERQATAILMGGITIEPVRNSRLVKISYESPNPAIASRVATPSMRQ